MKIKDKFATHFVIVGDADVCNENKNSKSKFLSTLLYGTLSTFHCYYQSYLILKIHSPWNQPNCRQIRDRRQGWESDISSKRHFPLRHSP